MRGHYTAGCPRAIKSFLPPFYPVTSVTRLRLPGFPLRFAWPPNEAGKPGNEATVFTVLHMSALAVGYNVSTSFTE